MKFPTKFVRYVGTAPAGGKTLGSDSLPSGKASPVTNDNLLSSRFSNINGWPVQRIAVTYDGPESAPDVTATMYFYEDATEQWYQIGAADVSMSPGTVTFFDVIALLDQPNTIANLDQAMAGSISQILICNLPSGSPPDGAYTFAMAPDLTSQA